ncbi:type-F conjugative transfer system pilin assembly protein TrbC [Bacillus pumilus]|uniref:Type-F conjugative transfer system pilin assembly protein TrbC n=1 Tax=Bacillus pumilus TaxID=1408 RepID=A0A2A5IJ24_BACPU|nr:type-F conjugative transfer system pilin assembly protein TrbC [Bacillus pumilus]
MSAAGGVLVIRGLVGNSMRQTVAALQSLVDKTGAETLVDPTLYQRFKVSRVPTIILTDGVLSPCSPEETNCDTATPVYDEIAGNVTLEYALSMFTSSGQTAERAIKHLVPLQQSFFDQSENPSEDW